MVVLSINTDNVSLKKLLVVFFILISFINRGFAQKANGITVINSFVDSLTNKLPAEKLYLQTDKNFYNPGDTLWLKGYLFDAKYFTPSTKSGVVYIELIDKNNKIAKRMIFEVGNGLFNGSIVLNTDNLITGYITLRAYTNWMRNWNTDFIFTKVIFFNNITAAPEANTFSNIATGKIAGSTARRSTHLKTIDDIDLQFMPEGGHLVNGLTSIVGFKALTFGGATINLSGKVYNSKNHELATFKSIHAGIGSFKFTPSTSEDYYAIITVGAISKKYSLPKAEASGVVLNVVNDLESGVIKVCATASNDITDKSPYYLIAQSRGALCYGAVAKFTNRKITTELQKSKFQSGIVRISLFDENLNPVCERITFVNHNDNLKISLKTDKQNYHTRDSVFLHFKVTNKVGEPVEGSFSVAVTDNGLVNADTTNSILTSLLLTGELKGGIDDPAYYLGNNSESQAALECLMLTQGWVSYRWNNFKIPIIKYLPQPEFTISGKITNLLNKGLPNISVKLFSKRPFFVMDTITNQNGNFTFRNLPAIDTGNFLLQAVKKNGNSKNVGFEMHDDQPAPVTTFKASASFTVDALADSNLLSVMKNNIDVKRQSEESLFGKNVLKEVVIKGKRTVNGSKNLNGPGNADQILDEKDMLKAAKMPLMDFLNQKIAGFHEGLFPVKVNSLLEDKLSENNSSAPTYTDKNLNVRKNSFMIKSHRVKFIFDGIDVENYFQPNDIKENPLERILFIKGVIEQFTAEDVKGMEVMYSGKYNNVYNAKISSAYEQTSFISPVNDLDYAYIEITTRSGKGPLINMKDGFYPYKPIMPSWSREFYKPKYYHESTNLKTDFRSTLHWEPNLVTNSKGEATIRFFTSDREGCFTIITEGSNINGLIGFGTTGFSVR